MSNHFIAHPPVSVVVIEPGGEITITRVDSHKRHYANLRALATEHASALALLQQTQRKLLNTANAIDALKKRIAAGETATTSVELLMEQLDKHSNDLELLAGLIE